MRATISLRNHGAEPTEDLVMNCPHCGSPASSGDTFCAACGSAIPGPVSPAPIPGPTSAPAGAAKRGLPTGAIIGIVAAVLALIGLTIAVGLFVVIPRLRHVGTQRETTSTPTASTQTPPPATPDKDVYETAEAAAAAAVPEEYVLELAEETAARSVFWAGPPSSEWDTYITVEPAAGGWKVTKTEPWSVDEAESGSSQYEDGASQSGVAEAEALVTKFLTAVKKDRPRDAQNLTISPLHEDPASAQVSNGDFTRFTIDEVQPRGDGTYWVSTTEVWTYGTDHWRYDVVPTEAGLRIRNLTPAE